MASDDLKEELTCCICLNLYTEPVTLQCGHNFCQDCITMALGTQSRSVGYSCPQCRAKFPEFPLLQKNTTLCNITEYFLSQKEQEECGVFCSYCLHTPVVAAKTCLWCKVSVCERHLVDHSKSPEHVFSDRRCPLHRRVLMFYCNEDAECLCVSCCLGVRHWEHNIELLNEAFKNKQEKQGNVQRLLVKQREAAVNAIQCLQAELRSLPDKAEGIVKGVSIHFRNLNMKKENLEKRVLDEISKQQEQVSLSVSDLIQQLEIRKDGLSKKVSAIEELCRITDPLLYLQADQDFLGVLQDHNSNLKELSTYDVDEDRINQTLVSGIVNIMSGLKKGYYVQEASGILLDVNTASNDVQISDDLKTASWSPVNQGRLKTPERFAIRRVLSMKGFCEGILYWDVEVSEEGGWRVGMSYPSIGRKGKYSLIGNNRKSWGLRRINKLYSVRHDRKEIPLAYQPSCNRVRIYLDYTAGQLSFYEIGISVRHIYTYNTTFTEALYPVISVWANAWMRILN
ncbi:E3 ubiquitin/ISG15 ligase TRIM25-like [Leptodactylus fuscus]|uniref:E3 ubiquitin/ISG15 ligase TRIM25-like n=1 Tax=Leptodactylus fuscus TaxID=238119 RepID=UPI003F4EF5E4